MNYTVKVQALSPFIGAKNKTAHFTHHEDAMQQFTLWRKWLDADLDVDKCDMITMRAVSKELQYEITITKNSTLPDCSTIDYDTRS